MRSIHKDHPFFPSKKNSRLHNFTWNHTYDSYKLLGKALRYFSLKKNVTELILEYPALLLSVSRNEVQEARLPSDFKMPSNSIYY